MVASPATIPNDAGSSGGDSPENWIYQLVAALEKLCLFGMRSCRAYGTEPNLYNVLPTCHAYGILLRSFVVSRMMDFNTHTIT